MQFGFMPGKGTTVCDFCGTTDARKICGKEKSAIFCIRGHGESIWQNSERVCPVGIEKGRSLRIAFESSDGDV